jgi:hypothetical protein
MSNLTIGIPQIAVDLDSYTLRRQNEPAELRTPLAGTATRI